MMPPSIVIKDGMGGRLSLLKTPKAKQILEFLPHSEF